jgi:outer membrane protein assembly factor BamE
MSANHCYSIRSALEVAALTVVSCVLLAGCSSTSSLNASSINPVRWITPYKVDVIQGNFISKEQVDFLKVGMTRAQVKDVLGTPLLASLFHADRWDYVFTFKRQGIEPQAFKYTVYFKGDLLERFEGDTMPSEAEFIAKLDSRRKLGKVPVLEASEEQLNKNAKSGAAPATPVTASAPAVSPAVTVYPPLESPKR